MALLPCLARADQPVVLRFRYWGDFKEIAVITQTIRQFEHDHPGVSVHGERVPPTDEYVQKLLVEQAAGLTPDVIFCGDNYPIFAAKGVLQDLTPYVQKDPSVKLSDYYKQVVYAFSTNGHLWALPRDIAPIGLLYYNKKLFDEAHIPYPSDKMSWDYVPHPERGYNDFLTVAKKLTHIGRDGRPIFGYAAGDTSFTMNAFVYSAGGSYVDDVLHPTKFLYTDPKVVKAIQLTRDMMSEKYNVSPSPIDLQSSGMGTVGTHELFDQSRVGMYLTGIWEVPRFRQEINDFDWDIAPFPIGPTGIRAVGAGGSGYAMAASGKHKDLAWQLIKYLAGPPGMSRLAQAGLAQPAIARLANSPLWLDNNRPRNRKITIDEAQSVHWTVLSPCWPEVNTEIVTPKLQLVWLGTITAQQAADQIQPQAQAILDNYNHPPYHPKLNWGAGVVVMLLVTLLLVAWIWSGARRDLQRGRGLGSASEARAGYLFITPWIIGGTVFLLAPMLISLVLAFSQWDMIEPAKFVGAGNFANMMHDERFWKSLTVTCVYTIFSVPLGIVGSLSLALLLNTRIKGQPIFRTLFYLPSVASAVAASLIWLRIFSPENGLLNSLASELHLTPLLHTLGWTDPSKGYVNWLGSEKTALGSLIVMSLWGVGGGMIIYLAGLQGIPQSYYEAADLDGAGVWAKFRHVTLPLLTPTIFFTLIMGFIGSFQVFTQGFVMTAGGPNNATLFYVLYLYQNAFQYLKMGYASALAWVLFIIILVVTILQMRMSRWVHYEGSAG